MNLVKALRLSTSPTLAFVGAGGKSTAMFQLARQLNRPVIVTATTHLGVWQIPLVDIHITATSHDPVEVLEVDQSGVILITGEIIEDRTQPLDDNTLNWLRAFCEQRSLPLLIEADGSRQRALKAPADHEPSIPNFVDHVIQVAGLTGLGKPLNENHVHRHHIFARLSKLKPGDNISPEALTRVLIHPDGGLKNFPEKARCSVLLNQADTPELGSLAEGIASDLLPEYASVIIASLQKEQVHAVHEPIAGIILAAGESKRFGQPKQLLEWRGEPFIHTVASTALEAGLSPVIIVTGAHAKKVAAEIKKLPVQVAKNSNWKSGQASSIHVGLKSAGDKIGAAIFLLTDQPQITPTLLQALMEAHVSSHDPIIAPMILDQRGNPVLFDRATFPDLMSLKGEVGGRGIFSKHKVTYLPWHDESQLMDVDTPEHYQRLKDTLE